MKTVLIFDQCEANVTFYVLDGDYAHLNRVYINQAVDGTKKVQRAAEKLQDELSNLIYHPKTGELLLQSLSELPVEDVIAGAQVIVAGMLP